jgi:hypothetical protein
VGGVLKEAGRLQVRYFSLLAPFIFAFVLPTAILQLLEVLGLAWWAAGQNPFLPPGPHHLVTAAPPTPPAPSGRAVLISLAVGIVMWLLSSLAVASIAKAVEKVYRNQEDDPSTIKSVFGSLPGAIYRLLVTSIWVLLLTIATIFTISLPFFLLGLLFKNNKHVLEVFAIVVQVLVSVGVTILGFLFMLSQEVAVLEPDHYGLTALKRSSKLVQEKFLAALTLFALSIVVGSLLSSLSNLVASKVAGDKLPLWAGYILAVLFAVVYLLFMVYVLLATIVLYFSSRAKYDGEQDSLPTDNPYTPLVVPAEE